MPKHHGAGSLYAVGVDIERVGRFRGDGSSHRAFVKTTFTDREIKYCLSKAVPSQHFAGTFAAKEAALKAVNGLVSSRLSIRDFEVSHGHAGAPVVNYHGADEEIKGIKIGISVSHTRENVVAVAIANWD